MNGSDVAVVDQPAPPAKVIDRALMTHDLERLRSELLAPLMLAGFSQLRALTFRLKVGPFSRDLPVGAWALDRLRAYLPEATSSAMAAITALPDGELYDLAAVIAGELGAWAQARPPLSDGELEAARPAVRRLLGTVEEYQAAGQDPVYVVVPDMPAIEAVDA